MSRKSPSLRDIAGVAKVSAATVSLALRNHASIPEATRVMSLWSRALSGIHGEVSNDPRPSADYDHGKLRV